MDFFVHGVERVGSEGRVGSEIRCEGVEEHRDDLSTCLYNNTA